MDNASAARSAEAVDAMSECHHSKQEVTSAGVILTTAMTAALYKRQTKAVERDNAAAQARMTAVANQAFRCISHAAGRFSCYARHKDDFHNF